MHAFTRFGLGLATAAVVALAVPGAARADSEVAKGEAVFRAQCTACHALPDLNRNMIGPSLHGVVGRHAGRAPGFSYSVANTDSNVVWTERKLDAYLMKPKAVVPPRSFMPSWPAAGTRMTFPGLPDAAERKAVIAYLNIH